MRRANYTLLGGLLLIAAPALAQTTDETAEPCLDRIDLSAAPLSGAHRSLERALTLTSAADRSGLFRASSMRATTCAAGFTFLDNWRVTDPDSAFEILPVHAGVFTNSAYPRTVNDGAAWRGVGVNFSASAGVRAHWRFLHASIAPEFYYSQNKPFTYVHSNFNNRSESANPYHATIDWPTRMGTEPLSTISPGQSYVQATAGPLSATFGTENLWMGAADVYPILMSYTAPGFAHVRLGTQRPIDLKVVRLEFQLLFASLDESDYFDHEPDNDNHYFTTSMVVIEPTFVPGLFLGVARVYHDTAAAGGHDIGYYASHLIETPFGAFAGGNRIGNAIGVLMARWVLPKSGFEAYAEWGREDTPGGWLDVLREPDWTQAYSLGIQKVFTKPSRISRLYAELIHLGESAPARAGRGFFSYYTHGKVTQGHTNEGQLLGAAIGPGSDAQLVGFDIFTGSGRSAFRIERTRYDDDTYYRTFARRFGETRHDAEITLSASRTQFIRDFEIEAGLNFSRRYGRQFLPLAAGGEDIAESNWSVQLGAGWRPNF